MAKKTEQLKNEIFEGDWLTFWQSSKLKGSLPIWLGFLLIIIAVVGVGYIGSKRVDYARQFYNVVFTINFLEDISPGTKVRYQGALTVGEVLYVVSHRDHHEIHAKIKKDFFIPRRGSSITMQTWGYFGSKFINISIIESFREYEAYQAGEKVPIEPITNSTIVMNNFNQMILKQGNQLSPLEQKLTEVKSMTKALEKNKFSQPRVMRRLIKSATSDAKNYFRGLNTTGEKGYLAFKGINEAAKKSVINLRNNLGAMKTGVADLRTQFAYQPGEQGFATDFWHEETQYLEAIEKIQYIRDKLAEYIESPAKIMFSEE